MPGAQLRGGEVSIQRKLSSIIEEVLTNFVDAYVVIVNNSWKPRVNKDKKVGTVNVGNAEFLKLFAATSDGTVSFVRPVRLRPLKNMVEVYWVTVDDEWKVLYLKVPLGRRNNFAISIPPVSIADAANILVNHTVLTGVARRLIDEDARYMMLQVLSRTARLQPSKTPIKEDEDVVHIPSFTVQVGGKVIEKATFQGYFYEDGLTEVDFLVMTSIFFKAFGRNVKYTIPSQYSRDNIESLCHFLTIFGGADEAVALASALKTLRDIVLRADTLNSVAWDVWERL